MRLREADANGWSFDEGWRLRANGNRVRGSSLIAPLYDRRGAHGDVLLLDSEPACFLVLRDISERRDASDRERRAVASDHLTGPVNRRCRQPRARGRAASPGGQPVAGAARGG